MAANGAEMSIMPRIKLQDCNAEIFLHPLLFEKNVYQVTVGYDGNKNSQNCQRWWDGGAPLGDCVTLQ